MCVLFFCNYLTCYQTKDSISPSKRRGVTIPASHVIRNKVKKTAHVLFQIKCFVVQRNVIKFAAKIFTYHNE